MPMKQKSFASTGFELITKRTRKREFLDEMELVVPWADLVALIEPNAPSGKTGRPPFAVATMLRIHFMQQCFGLSDPAMRPGKRSALDKTEQIKASVRAKAERPFRVIKCQFGFTKVRYKGLAKSTAQLIPLFALSNLWMARKRIIQGARG